MAPTAKKIERERLKAGEKPSKREAIVTAATRVFLECGYGSASMDKIASQAGVSKQTIYSHFKGKDDLFGAIVKDRCEQLFKPVSSAEPYSGKPGPVLADIAERFLRMMLVKENMASFRVVIAESGRFPELAEVFYSQGPLTAARNLAGYLKDQDREGTVKVADPQASARLFFAMLRGDIYMRGLLGIGPEADDGEIKETVAQAVNTFLLTHRP